MTIFFFYRETHLYQNCIVSSQEKNVILNSAEDGGFLLKNIFISLTTILRDKQERDALLILETIKLRSMES